MQCRYRVTSQDFRQHRGESLMGVFGKSPSKAVSSIYTDFDYKMWLFPSIPQNFWNDRHNRIDYVKWLIKEVCVKTEAELKVCHFEDHGGESLLRRGGGSSTLRIINSLREDDSGEAKLRHLNRRPKGYWVL